jgi:ankyrin repeat protein
MAAQKGAEDIIAVLLAAGADRRLRADDGRTAADVAREAGHAELADRLTVL